MALAEIYPNSHTSPPGRPCRRYWVHPLVMVGGNINDEADWAHLRDRYGIRAVVNLDHRDYSGLSIPALCQCPVEDDGRGFARQMVRQVVAFSWLWTGIGPVYVCCHIGVSRSAAFAYGILRWVFGMSEDGAVSAICTGEGEYGDQWEAVEKHRTYMRSVDLALAHR